MSLPPFPTNIDELSDCELGDRLLTWWVAFMAERQGPGASPLILADGFVGSLLAATGTKLDSNSAEVAPLEKAIKRVAAGDTVGGGQMFRQHWHREAHHLAALDEATTGRRRQKSIAKRPRPKTAPTHKTVTLGAMRRARRQNQQSLDGFLSSAENGSIAGISIHAADMRGVTKWTVECDELTKPKSVARSTLEGWWTEAVRPDLSG